MRLYISDLDGTLLNSKKEISSYTKNTINSLIEGGAYFSVATARTAASTLKILSGVNINIPVVLMNGVLVFDMQSDKYVKVEAMPEYAAKSIIGILKANRTTGFMYTFSGDRMDTYYERLESAAMQSFHDERVTRYSKTFIRTDNFLNNIHDNKTIYFMLLGDKNVLTPILNAAAEIPDISAVFYKDIYSEDLWYLEIYSINASKCNAIKYLRSRYGFKSVIGFGDNINDVPLFSACDESYAVSNAVGKLKDMASGVIGDNDSDSVARFISEREGMNI